MHLLSGATRCYGSQEEDGGIFALPILCWISCKFLEISVHQDVSKRIPTNLQEGCNVSVDDLRDFVLEILHQCSGELRGSLSPCVGFCKVR